MNIVTSIIFSATAVMDADVGNIAAVNHAF